MARAIARTRHGYLYVDVARYDCIPRACFRLGLSDSKRPVCMTRHIHGCPHHSVCPGCHYLELDGPGARCQNCGGTTVAREEDR